METCPYNYLVVGSNNFWYWCGDTEQEAREVVADVRSGSLEYGDPESDYTPDTPSKLFIFKVTERDQIYGEDDEEQEIKETLARYGIPIVKTIQDVLNLDKKV